MRAVIAVALALALPAAGLSAPFVHVHPDDHATEHHDGRALHAHVPGHAVPHHTREGESVESENHDRAVAVSAFVAVAVASFSTSDGLTITFELATPVECAAHRPVDIVHGHDPPALLSRSSRAPPHAPVLT